MILHYALPILKDNDNVLLLLFFSNANKLVYTKPKHIAPSWLYKAYVKIVFFSKMALDEIIEKHKKLH